MIEVNRMLAKWMITAVVTGLSFTAAVAQDDSRNEERQGGQASDSRPHEIVVPGHRYFRDLRSEIQGVQEEMFDRFNELNDNHRYDIHCKHESRPNTRIKQWTCMPNYVREATTQDAQQVLNQFQGGSYGNGATPPNLVIMREAPVMQEKLREFVMEDYELYELMVRHHELQEELQARTSTFFGRDE